ncbi:MAG: excinuclease ABC subunit UvrB, partial [Bacteriovoracaceae bacterium]|nr:excinuclease ABC subunit UvrB [Bacteriovoracaceae bacterium]
MAQFKLQAPFTPQGDQPAAIKSIVKGFKEKDAQVLLGATGTGKTFTMAHVIAALGKRTLVLAPNKTLAAQLYAEFKSFFPENAVDYFVSYYDYYRPEAYLPQNDLYIEKDAAINDEIDKLRHSTTRSLAERDDVIVVASVSCIYGIGSPDDYAALKIIVLQGDKLERDELIKKLVSIQYTRNDYDLLRGTFRVRGDTVDIFPPSEDQNVVRITFFGDQVESITVIDPLRQTLISELTQVVIYPKSHYVVGAQRMENALRTIKEELRERLQVLKQENKLLEAARLEQRTSLDLEMLEEIGHCPGIENYSRHLANLPPGATPGTLLDYFKGDFLLLIDESHLTVPQIKAMFAGDQARKQVLVNYGFRLPSALDNRPLNFAEFQKKVKKVLYVSATPAEYELAQAGGEFVEQIIRPTGLLDPLVEVHPCDQQVEDFAQEAKQVIAHQGKVLVTALTKRLAEELTTYYNSLGMKARYLHSDVASLERLEIVRDLRQGVFDMLIGINLLREGLDLPEVELIGIFDADKEGFLRSARALIQTIGRAARNKDGKV